jgi:predicted class III extradiol MEMO1 family dioxygenase
LCPSPSGATLLFVGEKCLLSDEEKQQDEKPDGTPDETPGDAGDAAPPDEPVPKLRSVEAIHYKRQGQDMFCLRDPMRMSDHEIHVSPDVFMIASLFDGERRPADIQREFQVRFGMEIERQNVAKVVEALGKAYFLEDAAFKAHRAKVEDEFRKSDVRVPIMAGSSYPAEPDAIRAFLDAFLTGAAEGAEEGEAPGPPEPCSEDSPPLRGLIVPHIDIRRGGTTFAHAYKAMWERPLPEVVILIGTAHAGSGNLFTFTRKDFVTPLGRVNTDVELTDRLASAVGERAFSDEYTHKGEHSVEIQLVWLQHMAAKYGGEVPRIVPVLAGPLGGLTGGDAQEEGLPPDADVATGGPCGADSPMELDEMKRFVEAVADVLREHEGKVMLLASADLAHIGQKFGDEVPLTPRLLRKNGEEDEKMLFRIEAGDADSFFEFVRAEKDRRRICGLTSIYACLAACAAAAEGEGVSGELLDYDQAPEDETQSVVSYVAMAIT